MRTITENLFNRLALQAEEAELQGNYKLSDNLISQIEKYSSNIRNDDDFYSYGENDFEKDINDQIWTAIIRMADFYGVRSINTSEIQKIVEASVDSLKREFLNIAGIRHGVGAYEEKLPGESTEKVDIEVGE